MAAGNVQEYVAELEQGLRPVAEKLASLDEIDEKQFRDWLRQAAGLARR